MLFRSAVKSFFTSGELLKEINSTIIALIPKSQILRGLKTIGQLFATILYTNAYQRFWLIGLN